MTEYRKRKDKDTWHWCNNCSNWPTSDYEVYRGDDRPHDGELCDECLAKEQKNDCHK